MRHFNCTRCITWRGGCFPDIFFFYGSVKVTQEINCTGNASQYACAWSSANSSMPSTSLNSLPGTAVKDMFLTQNSVMAKLLCTAQTGRPSQRVYKRCLCRAWRDLQIGTSGILQQHCSACFPCTEILVKLIQCRGAHNNNIQSYAGLKMYQ